MAFNSEAIMANPEQHRDWISRMGLEASVTLSLVVVLVLGVIAIQSAQARTFTVLYTFTGRADGYSPYAGLVRDSAGTLYGTTAYGGASGNGVVFTIDTSGTETVLYGFAGGTTDGCFPYGGLVRDSVGALYGTTEGCGYSGYYGTVFKVDTSGTETVLHNFTGGSDGCYPYGGLARDKAGNLYGITQECGSPGYYGTVFKVDTNGTETVLHAFAGGPTDGAYPTYTTLVMDKKRNLYGVTEGGGASGEGVVYVLSSTGALTVLHSFKGYPDGCYPYGTPAMDKMGNLYGTTNGCGSSDMGIVWKLSKKGTETVLHSFTGYPSDGADPYAGLIMDAKGNFYGDTGEGGTSDLGTVYELDKAGRLTLLHSFAESDGAYSVGGLLRDAKGDLYGTAPQGGSCLYGCGTAWKLTP